VEKEADRWGYREEDRGKGGGRGRKRGAVKKKGQSKKVTSVLFKATLMIGAVDSVLHGLLHVWRQLRLQVLRKS